MSELSGERVPLNVQVFEAAGALFTDNPSMVVPGGEFEGDHVHFVNLVPGRYGVNPVTGEAFAFPESYSPYVVTKSLARGFGIKVDHGAVIAAALPGERSSAERSRRFGVSTLFTGNDDDPTPVGEFSHQRYADGPPWVQAEDLDMSNPNDLMLLRSWLDILNAAEVYDPRTHGILHAPSLPNGLRAAPDRIATLEEIAANQRRVFSQQVGWARRIAGALFPQLLDPPQ